MTITLTTISHTLLLVMSKADKLPLETVARDNILTYSTDNRCNIVVKFLHEDKIRVCDGRYGGSVKQSRFGQGSVQVTQLYSYYLKI